MTSFLLAAGAWAGWFGWDTLRTVEPGADSSTGPYEIWQRVRAAITLAAIVIVAAVTRFVLDRHRPARDEPTRPSV